MKYTFYWEYKSDSEYPMTLGERLHCDEDVLEVSFFVEQGSIVLYSAFNDEGINILPTLENWEQDRFLKRLAENYLMRLNVEKQYNNYPHLAKPLTQEEQVEILKLK